MKLNQLFLNYAVPVLSLGIMLGYNQHAAANVTFSQDENDLLMTVTQPITFTATATATNSVYSVAFQNVFSTDITSAVFDQPDALTSILEVEGVANTAYSSWGYRNALLDLGARDFMANFRNSSYPDIGVGDTIVLKAGTARFTDHFLNGNARLPDVAVSTAVLLDASTVTAISDPVNIPEPASLALLGLGVLLFERRRRPKLI